MKPSTERVAEACPAAVEHYKAMRAAALDAPMLDTSVFEIVITAQFAVLGLEVPFKLHARNVLKRGVSKEQLRQVLLAGLGATMVIAQVARALDWLDDACT